MRARSVILLALCVVQLAVLIGVTSRRSGAGVPFATAVASPAPPRSAGASPRRTVAALGRSSLRTTRRATHRASPRTTRRATHRAHDHTSRRAGRRPAKRRAGAVTAPATPAAPVVKPRSQPRDAQPVSTAPRYQPPATRHVASRSPTAPTPVRRAPAPAARPPAGAPAPSAPVVTFDSEGAMEFEDSGPP
jgi:hypothetical protein